MNKTLIEIKEKIYAVLDWLLITSGTLYGFWLCFYTMFYGGIIQIVTEIQNCGNELPFMVAAGICKILFCKFGLAVPLFLGMIIGCIFLDYNMERKGDNNDKRKNKRISI